MSLIDETYFAYEPCYLAGLDSSNSEVSSPNLIEVRRSIKRFEPEYLTMLMGVELYAEYVSSISNTKWDELKALLVNATDKISPIANFVYYRHRYEHKFESGTNGDYITKKDNMVAVNPEQKMIISWNNMVDLNTPILKWIWDSVISAETPAIETTAIWDYSQWETDLLHKQIGY